MSFSNKPSFCVRTCLAKRVRSYIDLLSLQTQQLTMKWSEHQRSRRKSNQPMPADINKRAGSGLRVCAESGCYWSLKTNVDSNFGSSSGKMQAFTVLLVNLFVSKLGDDNLDIQCAICSNFVNFYAPGMVKTWGPQPFPVLIPYLPHTKPAFSNFE